MQKQYIHIQMVTTPHFKKIKYLIFPIRFNTLK